MTESYIILRKNMHNGDVTLPKDAPSFQKDMWLNGDTEFTVCVWSEEWENLRNIFIGHFGEEIEDNETELDRKNIAFIYSTLSQYNNEQKINLLNPNQNYIKGLINLIKEQRINLQWILFNYDELISNNFKIILVDNF